jgi:hypothetical protein
MAVRIISMIMPRNTGGSISSPLSGNVTNMMNRDTFARNTRYLPYPIIFTLGFRNAVCSFTRLITGNLIIGLHQMKHQNPSHLGLPMLFWFSDQDINKNIVNTNLRSTPTLMVTLARNGSIAQNAVGAII